jgi:hypothetical protein
LAAQVKTDDIGWNFNAQFYGSLYDELTRSDVRVKAAATRSKGTGMRNALTASRGLCSLCSRSG